MTLHFFSYTVSQQKSSEELPILLCLFTFLSFTSRPPPVLLFPLLISGLNLPELQFSIFIFCDLSVVSDVVTKSLLLSFLHIIIFHCPPSPLLILLSRTLFFYQILNIGDGLCPPFSNPLYLCSLGNPIQSHMLQAEI